MASLRPRKRKELSILDELRGMKLLEEGDPVEIPDLENGDLIEENSMSIIVRCLNRQVHKVGGLIKALPPIWGLEDRVRGRGVGDDKAQFHFESEGDLYHVLYKGPWFVNGWIVTLDQWKPHPGPDFLQRIQFWIRINGIPVHLLKRQEVESIIATMGKVDAVELHAKNSTSVEYVRARAWLNAEASLQFLKTDSFKTGEVVQLELTYEKLLKVCFICKRLTHDMAVCPYQIRGAESREAERHTSGIQRKNTQNRQKGKGKGSVSRGAEVEGEAYLSGRVGEIQCPKSTPRSVKERLQWLHPGDKRAGKRAQSQLQSEWRVKDTYAGKSNLEGCSVDEAHGCAPVEEMRALSSKRRRLSGSDERLSKKARTWVLGEKLHSPTMFERLGASGEGKKGSGSKGSGSKGSGSKGSGRKDSGSKGSNENPDHQSLNVWGLKLLHRALIHSRLIQIILPIWQLVFRIILPPQWQHRARPHLVYYL